MNSAARCHRTVPNPANGQTRRSQVRCPPCSTSTASPRCRTACDLLNTSSTYTPQLGIATQLHHHRRFRLLARGLCSGPEMLFDTRCQTEVAKKTRPANHVIGRRTALTPRDEKSRVQSQLCLSCPGDQNLRPIEARAENSSISESPTPSYLQRMEALPRPGLGQLPRHHEPRFSGSRGVRVYPERDP